MRDLKAIYKTVVQLKTKFLITGIEARFLFIDKVTYNELKYAAIRLMKDHVEYDSYIEEDECSIEKCFGLQVIVLPRLDEFISIGV